MRTIFKYLGGCIIGFVLGYAAITLRLNAWKTPAEPVRFTALACTDAFNKFVVVGVSRHVVRYPNYYEVTADGGERQTYAPSSYETCVTMSVETAVAKGLIKR